MKTRTKVKPSPRRFELRLVPYGNQYYIERVADLEKALARKPKALQIDLVGVGEIPADAALLLRSVLLARPTRTRLVTNARSSLRGGTVLIWLLGDQRTLRDDARLFFRPANLAGIEEAGADDNWRDTIVKYQDSFTEVDPGEGDYARVLQLIDEFLPVKELAGRLIGLPVLRQFGLVENEKVDQFLAGALGKSERPIMVQE